MIDPYKNEVRDYIKYTEDMRVSDRPAPAAGKVGETGYRRFPKWPMYVIAAALTWFVASSYTSFLERDVRRDLGWLTHLGSGDGRTGEFRESSYKGIITKATETDMGFAFRFKTEASGNVWLHFLDVEIPDDKWARNVVKEQMVGKEMLVTRVTWHAPEDRLSGNIEFRQADIGSYFVSKGVAVAKAASPKRIHELESIARSKRIGVWSVRET